MDNLSGALGGFSIGFVSIAWVTLFAKKFGTLVPSIAMFLVHTVLGLSQLLVLGLRDDELTYFRLGSQLARGLQIEPGNASSGISDGKESFVWILALLILVWGESAIPGVMANVLFLTFLPTVLVLAGRNFGLISSGRITAWLIALGPPLLVWGAGLKREPLAFLLLALLILALSCLYRERFLPGLVLIFFVVSAIAVTRSNLLAVAAAGLFAVTVFLLLRRARTLGNLINRTLHNSSKVAIPGLLSLSAFAIFVLPLLQRYPYLPLPGEPIRELVQGQSTTAPNLAWAIVDSPLGLTFHLIRSAYNFLRSLVGPMPWEVTNFSLVFFWAEATIYLIFFTAILVSFVRLPTARGRILLLVATASPLVIANFLWLSNYGLGSRVKAHIFLLLVLAIGALVEDPALRSRQKLRISWPWGFEKRSRFLARQNPTPQFSSGANKRPFRSARPRLKRL